MRTGNERATGSETVSVDQQQRPQMDLWTSQLVPVRCRKVCKCDKLCMVPTVSLSDDTDRIRWCCSVCFAHLQVGSHEDEISRLNGDIRACKLFEGSQRNITLLINEAFDMNYESLSCDPKRPSLGMQEPHPHLLRESAAHGTLGIPIQADLIIHITGWSGCPANIDGICLFNGYRA